MGVASIHTGITPHAVHRDIKPANVLIDDDMHARITDFGFAKYIGDGKSHKSFSFWSCWNYSFHCTRIFYKKKVYRKCDIFGFGILLAVLVFGKLPNSDFFKHTVGMDMILWLLKVTASNDRNQAIHPTLLGTGHEKHVLKIITIACKCANFDPNRRSGIKECVAMLRSSKV